MEKKRVGPMDNKKDWWTDGQGKRIGLIDRKD